MRKYLLAIASLLASTVASAQMIGGYKATATEDVASKEATVISNSVEQDCLYLSDASATRTVAGKAFPIGFEFPFNGGEYKYFGVSAQGLIKLFTEEDATMTINSNSITQENEDGSNTVFCYDIGVFVELPHLVEEFLLAHVVFKADERALEATGFAGYHLVLDVGFAAAVVAHEYRRQMRSLSSCRHDALYLCGYLLLYLSRRGFSVD